MESDLRIAQQEELNEQEPKREELENVEAMVADAEREATQVARALRGADGAVGRALEKDKHEVNARCGELSKPRAELQAELGARLLTDDTVGSILQFARDVKEGIEHADESDKRYYLEMLGVTVKITDGHFLAKCLIGEWDGEIKQAGDSIVHRSA